MTAQENEVKTLRDEIAIGAINASVAYSDNGKFETVAKIAYEIADAMLEARKIKEKPDDNR